MNAQTLRVAALAIGIIIVIQGLAGLAAPEAFADLVRAILGWWSDGGPAMVRIWAAGALALGAFIVYATRRTSVA